MAHHDQDMMRMKLEKMKQASQNSGKNAGSQSSGNHEAAHKQSAMNSAVKKTDSSKM